jgi:hypothetical protein
MPRRIQMSEMTWEQFDELRAQMKSGRITRELVQAFLLNPEGHRVGGKERGTYPVVIDYGKSVEDMVVYGNYNWSNPNITSKSFPLSGTGNVSVSLELVHLNKSASTQEVLAYLEANGLRAATIEELLAFGLAYPEIQREFPVVALGSSWVDSDGRRDVPYLGRGGSDRELRLYWSGSDWLGVCRFLAVRKIVK